MLESLRDMPIVGDVRGAGYFHAIELVKDKETKESFNDEESEELLRGFLSGELYKRGLICRADDRGDPVIQLAPPLIADTEQFEEIHDVLRGVLTEACGRGPSADGAPPVLTVQSLLDELDLDLAAGAEAAEAPVRWVHISELEDPTPWLSGGELMLTTGHPARHRRQAARLRPPARRPQPRRARLRHRLQPRRSCRRRWSTRPRSATSRSSRSPTRRRSSRSPRRPSPASSTSSTRCCSAGIAVQRRLERLVLEERGLEEIAATIASAVGGTVAILDGRGERLAGRGFRRQLSADAVGGDPQGGARPRRRRPPLRPLPPLGRRPGARPPGDLARAAARRRPGS